ncbi:MAG: acetate kinase [Kiritimatiellaeota bacterium]|nr:acetate kinase [Kiritimatiellota bacterium]
MKILVINAGSSSLKFTLFNMKTEEVLAKGLVERIGLAHTHFIYKRGDGLGAESNPKIVKYEDALKIVCEKLVDPDMGVLKSLKEVDAIGHRVVHGGEQITKPALIDEHVKDIIKDCFSLAPLHNPPNMAGIEACEKIFKRTPCIAVFDTAFHQTMPPEAYLYAIPYELYTKYGIRRYGFHGTSHSYVARATAKFLEIPFNKLKLITCHLGNGCSITAINKGIVHDTSMGMTPLEGLVMGTRCGDIDPAIVIRMFELGMTVEEIDKYLNKKSGLLGVGGIGSSDMRDIIAAADNGDQQALRALRMFIRRIVKYTGAYYALLGGADAIVFTGGIGEGSALIRRRVIDKLASFGIRIAPKVNDACKGKEPATISSEDSAWRAIVMPTNEELMIARETVLVISHENENPEKE